MRVILDTNIYLAALREGGFVFKLLREILRPDLDFIIYISPSMKDELEEKLQGWINEGLVSADAVVNLRGIVDEFVNEIFPREKILAIKADPDDDKILECAVEARADLIVSMDKHVLKLKQFRGIPIVHPKTFSFMIPVKG